MKGMLITLEGIDGCGKTTQSRKLKNYLVGRGYSVVLLREPGGERISEKIREILLSSENSGMAPLTELLLYCASRSQLVQKVVMPRLKMGRVIICDRFYDSTLAYQGYGRNLDKDAINCLNRIAVGGMKPDLTVLIDCSPKAALGRKAKKGACKDRLEQENLRFYKRVRDGYLMIASANRKRFKVVEGSGDKRETWLAIKRVVDEFLRKRRCDAGKKNKV